MAQNQAKKPKSLIIAEYFIKQSQKEHKVITNKKLQKLLYYAQAWNLVFNDKKMFDEPIEAWVHGPAVPIVYDTFKSFGFGEIAISVDEKEFELLADEEKTVLDDVWKAYGKFDGDYLELLTHNELPWQEARGGIDMNESSTNEISTVAMKEYYGRRLKEIAEK